MCVGTTVLSGPRPTSNPCVDTLGPGLEPSEESRHPRTDSYPTQTTAVGTLLSLLSDPSDRPVSAVAPRLWASDVRWVSTPYPSPVPLGRVPLPHPPLAGRSLWSSAPRRLVWSPPSTPDVLVPVSFPDDRPNIDPFHPPSRHHRQLTPSWSALRHSPSGDTPYTPTTPSPVALPLPQSPSPSPRAQDVCRTPPRVPKHLPKLVRPSHTSVPLGVRRLIVSVPPSSLRCLLVRPGPNRPTPLRYGRDRDLCGSFEHPLRTGRGAPRTPPTVSPPLPFHPFRLSSLRFLVQGRRCPVPPTYSSVVPGGVPSQAPECRFRSTTSGDLGLVSHPLGRSPRPSKRDLTSSLQSSRWSPRPRVPDPTRARSSAPRVTRTRSTPRALSPRSPTSLSSTSTRGGRSVGT